MSQRVRHRRADVVARVVGEFERLDEVVARLRPEDWERRVPRSETRDPWTVKDAIAHIVYWKAHAARVARREPPPADERGLEYTEQNRVVYERWRDRPAADVLAWHRQVHEEVLAALAAAPDEWFGGRERSAEWPSDLDGHSAAHRVRDLEAALGEA